MFKQSNWVFGILLISVLLILSACSQHPQKSESILLSQEVDEHIQAIQERNNIPGVSLAIVRGCEVLHKKHYGNANLEHGVPAFDDSVYRLYSLTKPVVATAIFQLIEEDKLALDDRIGTYVDDVPSSWQTIKIGNLLRHTSGLPEIRNYDQIPEEQAKQKIYQDPLVFEQETRFQYNQTNYWLLLRIIEKLSGQSIEGFILDNQFSGAVKSDKVFFSTDSRDIYPNRVSLYFPFETGRMQTVNHHGADYLTSANGLNSTLDEFLNWSCDFTKDRLISKTSKRSMWSSVKFANDPRRWSFGWNEYTLNDHKSYGFSGSMVTVFRHFPDDDISIIYFTNGFEHWYSVETVVNHLAYLVDHDIFDPATLAYETLLQSAITNMSALVAEYQKIKVDDRFDSVNFDKTLNSMGYTFLKNFAQTDAAIEIFKINVAEHPDSYNVYDSLAEAYEIAGQFDAAVNHYLKARELNPDNDYRSIVDEKVARIRQR